MNVITLTGRISTINKMSDITTLMELKIDHPYFDDSYINEQLIPLQLNSIIFKKLINILKPGNLVSVKGRIENTKNELKLIVEGIKTY